MSVEFQHLGLMVRRRAIAGAACVHLAAMRAVSKDGRASERAAILRDALASLGLLRMRSEGWKDSQPLPGGRTESTGAQLISLQRFQSKLTPLALIVTAHFAISSF